MQEGRVLRLRPVNCGSKSWRDSAGTRKKSWGEEKNTYLGISTKSLPRLEKRGGEERGPLGQSESDTRGLLAKDLPPEVGGKKKHLPERKVRVERHRQKKG